MLLVLAAAGVVVGFWFWPAFLAGIVLWYFGATPIRRPTLFAYREIRYRRRFAADIERYARAAAGAAPGARRVIPDHPSPRPPRRARGDR